MSMKNLLLVGATAAAAFWLLSRRSHAQANAAGTGTSYGATITTTAGESIQLREQNGLIVDQHGGIWT